jgi:hypothetical protein
MQLFACAVAKLYIAELAARSANHCRNAWQASQVVHAQFFPWQMTATRSAMQWDWCSNRLDDGGPGSSLQWQLL